MDEILRRMLETAPSAVACIVIVIIFIRHIEQRESRQEVKEDKRSDALNDVLEMNTTAIKENTKSIQRSNDLMERVENRLRNP